MALRITKEQAYKRGFDAARGPGWFSDSLQADIETYFPKWREEFPLTEGMDYSSEIVRTWKERLDAPLDLAKYPEARGARELVFAEHQGYVDGSGGNEVEAAYFFNFSFFYRLRLMTRYFGFDEKRMGTLYPYVTSAAECTTIWFADTPDGPAHAKNLDTCPNQLLPKFRPGHLFVERPIRGVVDVGGATSSVICDDEPDEIFPLKVDDIVPEDIETVYDYVPFRNRYREFCQPGNTVFVDANNDAVAIEHTNTKMGWQFATGGVCGVTGLAYQSPELRDHKAERDKLSLEKRGWDETSPDAVYWDACNRRCERLVALMDNARANGPTVEALAEIMLDPNGPLPQRISTANEQTHPLVETDFWTMATWVTVMYGPERRTYRWANPPAPDGPIWNRECELLLEEGVEMRDRFEQQRQALNRIGK